MCVWACERVEGGKQELNYARRGGWKLRLHFTASCFHSFPPLPPSESTLALYFLPSSSFMLFLHSAVLLLSVHYWYRTSMNLSFRSLENRWPPRSYVPLHCSCLSLPLPLPLHLHLRLQPLGEPTADEVTLQTNAAVIPFAIFHRRPAKLLLNRCSAVQMNCLRNSIPRLWPKQTAGAGGRPGWQLSHSISHISKLLAQNGFKVEDASSYTSWMSAAWQQQLLHIEKQEPSSTLSTCLLGAQVFGLKQFGGVSSISPLSEYGLFPVWMICMLCDEDCNTYTPPGRECSVDSEHTCW